MTPPLRIETTGRVMVLTIDNPDQRNALHPDVYHRGAAALAEASADPAIGAVVLTGAGATFSSGGNLNRLKANREQQPEVQRASVELLHGFVRAIRATPVPVIAAVEGIAAGAGFSLALACDLLVAAEDARFIMAYVKVGLNPDGGATAFLARGLPPQLAAELLFTGAPIGAERLAGLGVVNRLVPPGRAHDKALAWASEIASGPRAALGRAKRLIEAAPHQDLDRQLDLEAELMTEAVHHAEAGEGIDAFLTRRKPDFTGT
jgi:enoyl-CoA hydratase/carnithine racemase